MKLLAPLALLLIALAGCGEEKIVIGDIPDTPDSLAKVAPSESAKVDVGDVEATVDVELTLEKEGMPGISAEELRNAKKKLNSLTLTVSPPKPAELWFKVLLKTNENFGTRPTALRGKVIREVTPGNPEEIFTFQTILDGFSSQNRRVADGEYFPLEFRTDAVAGLTELPDTMLLYVTVEAFMSPTGTDPASIDAATYTTGPEDTGSLMSNPVRINYVSMPTPEPAQDSPLTNPLGLPAASAEAPAAEAPAVEAPAPEAQAVEVPAPAAASDAAATEPATETATPAQ